MRGDGREGMEDGKVGVEWKMKGGKVMKDRKEMKGGRKSKERGLHKGGRQKVREKENERGVVGRREGRKLGKRQGERTENREERRKEADRTEEKISCEYEKQEGWSKSANGGNEGKVGRFVTVRT